MNFSHSKAIWSDFPGLVAGAIFAEGFLKDVTVSGRVANFNAIAQARLDTAAEGALPEIQAWRSAFSQMGLKPTQYRCASEALLRRFRKEGALPQLHPLIDLCNAISLAFAIPIAVFDVSSLEKDLEVRYAEGTESYLTFSGEIENPERGEVIFADAIGRAHARRWTNRQSACSAVRPDTDAILIVTEAMHSSAPADVRKLIETIADELATLWFCNPKVQILAPSTPEFAFQPSSVDPVRQNTNPSD